MTAFGEPVTLPTTSLNRAPLTEAPDPMERLFFTVTSLPIVRMAEAGVVSPSKNELVASRKETAPPRIVVNWTAVADRFSRAKSAVAV